MNEDLLYLIALLNIKGVGSSISRHLIEVFGSAKAVFEADSSLLINMPHIGKLIIDQRNDPSHLRKAEAEIQFIHNHHIKTLVYGQEGYPFRLLDCPDAPALLFYIGNANLENRHIISIVGTRNATQYGKDNVFKFVKGIKEAIPDAIIVSGLALGIDISAHKAALENELPTIGVVAHGLDMIYPSVHRNIAKEMIEKGGGLISEYTSGVQPERGNFLQRNRLIAGLADAVIVAESKEKGGSLVTASIALDYGHDVFAFPGRTGDTRSFGCNRLIRLNRAGLITCAEDFLEGMNWYNHQTKHNAVERSINFEEDNLTDNDRLIIDALTTEGDLRVNQLSNVTGLDHSTLLEALLDLEMNGRIRSCPGGLYQLK